MESAWVLMSRWMDKDRVVQMPCGIWFNCKERNDATCQSIDGTEDNHVESNGPDVKRQHHAFSPIRKIYT